MNSSYKGSDYEEELKTVPVENDNNHENIVSNSNSESSSEDFKNNEGNFFHKDINHKVIASHKTTVNAKVVQAMKKLQASYNYDANKIIKEVTQVKVTSNLNFLINLAMDTKDTNQVPEEHVCSMNVGIIPMQCLEKNGKKLFSRNSPI